MAYSPDAREVPGYGRAELADLADAAVEREPARRGYSSDSEARRIVPTIFKAFEPLEKKRGRVTISRIADDSAHVILIKY
jgi:hypothetical protein